MKFKVWLAQEGEPSEAWIEACSTEDAAEQWFDGLDWETLEDFTDDVVEVYVRGEDGVCHRVHVEIDRSPRFTASDIGVVP